MKTKRRFLSLRSPALVGSASLLTLAALFPASLQAQTRKKNPASKVYVSDVNGDASIDTGDNIQDLNKRSVYTAQGTIIETRKAEKEEAKGKVFSTMVYSNGTGAFFDEDTRVEVKNFVQEPFTPNRSDMDVEPSISQTQAYVPRGTVALCNSKLVAGSNMTYRTPHGGINIRGKKIVIEASDNETKVSMLEGDSTVRGGDLDLGGQTLKAGQQAIIRRGAAGQPSSITVQPIPPAESAGLDDKVAMACMAKKTVYFEVKERAVTTGGEPGSPEAAVADSVAAAENTASGGSTTTTADTASGASTSTPFTNSDPVTANVSGPVTAFDGPVVNSGFATGGSTLTVQEIVVVPVVPVNLPVQFTVSPARIVTPTPGG